MKFETKKLVLGLVAQNNEHILETIESTDILGDLTYEDVEMHRRQVQAGKPLMLAALGALFHEDPKNKEIAQQTVEALQNHYQDLNLGELATVI